MFVKIFESIFDSSIADDWQLRIVFQDLLVLADKHGVVDMTAASIHRRTNVPLDIVQDRLAKLESPDASSRTPDHEGRRIIRLDPHRDWGWRIVNYAKYRESASKEMLRMSEAERKRAYRAKFGGKSSSPIPPTTKTEAEAEAEQSRTCPGHVRDILSNPEQSSVIKKPSVAGATPASKSSIESDWLLELRSDPAFSGIDVDRELAKMNRWCSEHRKQSTRRRFINWLNRCDRTISSTPSSRQHTTGTIDPSQL